MHLALSIPEIVSLIIHFVEKVWDIARCARVCQSWFLPSIENLWRFGPIKHRLGWFMKGNGIDTIGTHGRGSDWVFSRDLTQKDWDRLYLYTSQIQELSIFPGYDGPTLPLEKWSSQYAQGRSLFPRARSFYLMTADGKDIKLGATLITHIPQLSKVSLYIGQVLSETDSNDLWACVRSVCDKLTTLDLTVTLWESETPDEFWNKLGSILPLCTKLEAFIGPKNISINPHVFSVLATLPNLKTLQCSFHDSTSTVDFYRSRYTAPVYFQALEGLRVHYGEVLELGWFPPKNLKELDFYDVNASTLDRTLRRLTSQQVLIYTLRCKVLDTFHPSQASGLFGLRSIRSLSLTIKLEGTSSDECIEKIATQMHGLEEFELSHLTGRDIAYTPISHPTLLSVYHLVERCPNIKRITLQIETYPIPLIPSHNENRSSTPSPALLNLDFGWSVVHSPADVACWMAKCCWRYTAIRFIPPPPIRRRFPIRSATPQSPWVEVERRLENARLRIVGDSLS